MKITIGLSVGYGAVLAAKVSRLFMWKLERISRRVDGYVYVWSKSGYLTYKEEEVDFLVGADPPAVGIGSGTA